MSSGKRKLSFLGFAPQQATGDDEVQLDEEMDRVVWSEGAPRPPDAGGAPRRDPAAPPPYSDEGASAERGEPAHDPLQESTRRVQWDGAPAPAPDAAAERDRRGERNAGQPQPRRPSAGRDAARAPAAPDGDGAPRSVFVQLDELVGLAEAGAGAEAEGEWREAARWIKYEEDVEEGALRWGRPHVATLSFHSLLNLRRALETGAVLLELPERDLPAAAWRVAQAMLAEGLIAPDDTQPVLRALLLRHQHVHDARFRFSLGGGGRKHESHTSLQSLAETRRRRSSHALAGVAEARKKSAAGVEGSEASAASSQDELRPHNEALMRRIPAHAEATSVLVGAVAFLARPTVAFVRLAQAVPMPGVTSVPVPVRFMFVLLGPPDAELDYREVGRSIATLMANPAFLAIAYRALDRRDLLSAINEFLDDSIVLPPGDWERSALLPLDELRAKSEMIRRRKRDALERRHAAAATVATAAPADPRDEKLALLAAESALPVKEPDDPLCRTGRLFGGVVRDMRRRYPHYVSDFRDALNGQCVAAAIFMYFAALSSAITFGGLLAEKTHGQIGISETLVFTCVGGVLFALVAGQPMMITGATGPLLLLDESLAGFCRAAGFDFLTARMYAGLWMVVIALAVASLEGSVAVKKITRFTEDIFAFLISLIFISEPITATFSVYRAHPLGADYCAGNVTGADGAPDSALVPATNATLPGAAAAAAATSPQPNTALWCTMLTLATFAIAYYLRIFRNGKFLGRSARRALGDFGVPIAIVVMVGVSCGAPVWTETLRVPAGLSPTAPRPWLVPLGAGAASMPAWAVAAMALPALMVYIIVFMETHIAELIVDKPERRLRKGSGFHMDVVVMSLVNALCGLCGAPWQCVATVRSVSHVAALTVMSRTHAPGDKPHIVEVKEQRLTGLAVSLLVGLSVLAARWLRAVPMAVLFGVFLYMGISALAGIQLWERAVLLLKPVKHHPQVPYVRRVPTARMHLYTAVQLAGLALLYAVKSSRISLALPFFLVLMVPLRMSLALLFTPLQLRALDGAQKDIDEDDEPDFYQEAPLPG